MIKTWEKKIHGRFSTKVTKNREILEVLYDCERIVSYIMEEKKTREGGSVEVNLGRFILSITGERHI